MGKHRAGRLPAVLLTLTWIAVVPAAARADDAAERLAVAREVVAESGAVAASRQSVRTMIPLQIPQLRRQLGMTDAEVDQFVADFMAEFENREPDLAEGVAAAFAQRLSLEELTGLRSFYRSPAGKALVREQNAITAATMQVGERIGALAGMEAGRKLAERRGRVAEPQPNDP